MSRVFLFAVLIPSFFGQPTTAREPEAIQTIEELETGIQSKSPATYFALATELFRSGQKDNAAFWYYVGQLRYRFLVLAKAKASEPSDEQAHFWLLSESVGQSIYEKADQRSAALVRAYPKDLAALAPRLASITLPVAIVVGRNDPYGLARDAALLRERLPHARLDVLEAGHCVWEERAPEFESIVTQWVGGGFQGDRSR